MRKFASIILAICMILGMATMAGADDQLFKVKITDLIDHYSLLTNWGTTFFNDHDVKKLTHAAANLRPINLGDFKTDKGNTVQIKAISYKAGVAKLIVTQVYKK